jgi:hypothetical protein
VTASAAALLMCIGLAVYPTARSDWKNTLAGLVAVLVVLAGYTALGVWGSARIERLDGRLLRLAWVFGLLAGTVYAVEIVLEYIYLRFGLAVLGGSDNA